MSSITSDPRKLRLLYPDDDGEPMADNTLQFQWIVTLQGGLDALFHNRPDVFVAGNLLWYPVEGHPEIRQAPDALVVFGRPKGYRGSYMQFVEGNVAPQVVFEVLSPGNRHGKMIRKFRFYERYGVEEYYIYDPDEVEFTAWRRQGPVLEEIPEANGWISPLLGVRFNLTADELQVLRPDGRRFATYLELAEQREQAQRQAEQEKQARELSDQKAARLAAQLRALGVNPEA